MVVDSTDIDRLRSDNLRKLQNCILKIYDVNDVVMFECHCVTCLFFFPRSPLGHTVAGRVFASENPKISVSCCEKATGPASHS